MKRILFLNRYYAPDTSATSQMLTDLSQGLVRRGFDVHVITSRQVHHDPRIQLLHHECRSGVQIHRVATTRFGRHWLPGRLADYLSYYVSCALMLLWLLRRHDVLVVKTDPPLLSMLVGPVSRWRRARLINWQQDVFPEVIRALGLKASPRWLEAALCGLRDRSLRLAATNVLIGGRMYDYFVARKIPAQQLRVIDNWADGNHILPKLASMSALRTSLDLKDCFVTCYSGNLGRAHEFETLLGAAHALRDDPRHRFLIIGEGAKYESLRRAVAERGLESFHFVPHQPRESLGDSMAAADVHLVSLLPTAEGFIVPSKLYGILAAGRPVIFIGDADGEVARIIRQSQCGLTVGIGACEQLRDHLKGLAEDTDSVARLGRNARQAFETHYTFDHALTQWESVIAAA